MPALDALTLKAQFLHEMHDPAWWGYINGYAKNAESGVSWRDALPADQVDPPAAMHFWPRDVTGADITRRLEKVTQMSHAYYVSPTMQVLVTAASHDWPEDELIREDDFPQPQGWLYIPGGGITTLDIRGRVMATNVLLWDCYNGGVDIHLLSDKYSPADLYYKKTQPEMWKAMVRLSPWHHIRVDFDYPVPQGVQMGKAVPPEIADQVKVKEMPNGQMSIFFPEGWSKEELQPSMRPFATLTWLMSCLRIMQQPLASVEKQGLPSGFRKGLARYKIKMKNTLVSVIEYRRREGEYNHNTGRQLSHRYFRRGHWKRQHFKDEHGEWQTKSIRIQPQIVGDPSLPLMLREHVNALIR
jgi:hypothetical protein